MDSSSDNHRACDSFYVLFSFLFFLATHLHKCFFELQSLSLQSIESSVFILHSIVFSLQSSVFNLQSSWSLGLCHLSSSQNWQQLRHLAPEFVIVPRLQVLQVSFFYEIHSQKCFTFKEKINIKFEIYKIYFFFKKKSQL